MDNKYISEYKEWTVLIYAAGNNNLQEFIYNQFESILTTTKTENVNVIVQISEGHSPKGVNFNECKRYVIDNNKAILLKDLGKISMAQPEELKKFVVWGSNRFPSRHIAVIMSGHSAGFVGLMKDCSGEQTSFMGIKGFAKTLYLARRSIKRYIDVLVMDTCFMDTVEIWYDIIINSRNAVKYVILPQDNAPKEGLSYNEIINSLNKTKNGFISYNSMKRIINDEMKKNNIFCVFLASEYFSKLKEIIDLFSQLLLMKDKNINNDIQALDFIPLIDLCNNDILMDSDINKCNKVIKYILDKIILEPDSNIIERERRGLKIYFPHNYDVYSKFKGMYNSMKFSHNNMWTQVIDDKYMGK
ncbi:clostripain-related cysteine peptidase [Vallitalea guaymasensis]|uniref:Uncharacterized protein n=1 Tax=Vallitalea guaymasensis TaxID=1185412 RepID=A0A8J8SCN4_9FIRM|nr:clostripain-related cysteine peptidase [Vallitalea guaymasensis]QUH29859.1 hypothetical protein HYG85_13440 [Vallitalea guaymasensis]